LRHRIGGLEKEDVKGNVSTDPHNHEVMVNLRNAKIQKIADYIPEQAIEGADKGDLLVVSWGGTKGAVTSAVKKLQVQGKQISHAHFSHIMPLPKNTADILKGFKKILVCELNNGQFINYLRMTHPGFAYQQFNKVQGLPFLVSELMTKFNHLLEEK
jgi:2-oxoglutarate ferredoxin oxidoreductase subunit alpha